MTRPAIDALLALIDAERRAFNQAVQPPAPAEVVEWLRRDARDTLRTELPVGYLVLLCRSDGFDFNGYVIYAATQRETPFHAGFAEVNTVLGGASAQYVFYGETGDELFAQDRASGAWVMLDRPSLGVIAAFPSFDAMLERVLRDAYEQ